jgi:uncharacterized protein YecE (DUF72 family)
MNNILIGIASWTDKSLIASGRFYPPKCNTPEERLRCYASQFPLVEIDSSYYAMPKPEVAQLWAERTPGDFTFNIKAFRLFTGHQTSPAALPKDIVEALGPVQKRNLYYKNLPREISDEMCIEPLKRSGKLAAVHFQFAPWVAYHPKNRDHIEECQRQLEGCQLAIEFRNRSWFEDRHAAVTLAFERERKFVNVIVDEPQGMANTTPSVWEVTNPALAIVRLHGRNHETWNKKGLVSSAQRFNYDYDDDELAELGEKIEAITAASAHVVLNNLCGGPHKLFNAEPIVMRRRRNVSVRQRPPLRDAHDRCTPSYPASVGPTPGEHGMTAIGKVTNARARPFSVIRPTTRTVRFARDCGR